MSISLQINDSYLPFVTSDLIGTAVAATLKFADQPATSLVSVVITGAEQVQALNQHYRGVDVPTDVLSFANNPDPDFPLDPAEQTAKDAPYLGDIVIAYPVAETQAAKAHHTPAEEVALLTIHGVLHLLGFDHATADQKAAMWQAQGQILTELGLGHVHPTEI